MNAAIEDPGTRLADCLRCRDSCRGARCRGGPGPRLEPGRGRAGAILTWPRSGRPTCSTAADPNRFCTRLATEMRALDLRPGSRLLDAREMPAREALAEHLWLRHRAVVHQLRILRTC